MKKVKFTGTVNTFYCVPNCENETAILYLDVNSEQKLPDGKEEAVVPARKMRFMLGEREVDLKARRALHAVAGRDAARAVRLDVRISCGAGHLRSNRHDRRADYQ